jgi:hypothetical protein
MNKLVYRYANVGTILDFAQSDKFVRGLMGPFGSGKSSGCVMELVRIARKQPLVNGVRRSRFAIIRNTYRQLQDTAIRTVHDWLPPRLYGTYFKSDSIYVLDRLDPELYIEVLYRALDRPEQVANLLSLELTAAWVNEGREVPLAVIKALKGRVGRFPAVRDGGCVDPGIIMDTNPPDEESWWWEMFENDPAHNVVLFKQPSGLSPEAENVKNLPAKYYENLSEGEDEAFINVYVHGKYGFVRDGKPVYPDYNDEVHCTTFEINPDLPIKRGWDFGLTPACVFTQVSASGRFLVFDEMVAEDLGISRFSDAVLLHCSETYPNAEFEDYGDPAGKQRAETDEKTCFQVLHGKGINIKSGKQSVTLRIECVNKPLNTLLEGKPQLLVHPRCKVVRRGFQGRYQYKRVKITGAAERYHDKPDKNDFSHPHDALQYVATKVFANAVQGKKDYSKMKLNQTSRWPE